jgi:uncharacterized repeat protein (TIGR01451 family)
MTRYRLVFAQAVFATLAMAAAGFSQEETHGVRLPAQRGITETVDEIMQRERLAKADTRLRESKREVEFKRPARANPDAPAVSRWPIAEALSAVPEPHLPQTVGTSFLGMEFITDSNFVPPDSMGAVGPTQVLVGANGRIRVFDKSGVMGTLNTTFDNFFASVGGASGTSDPRIRYDRLSQRWFVSIITVASCPNQVLIAVSSGPTITGTGSFTFFTFTPETGAFVDYGTLGVDANALYIGGNIFDVTQVGCPAPSSVTVSGYVVRKSDLLSGILTVTAFRNLHTAGIWTPQGVDNDDPAATQGYFIGVDFNLFSRLGILRVSNPGSATPTISAQLNVTVPTTAPAFAQPQPVGPALDALDDRLYAAMIRQNKITGTRTLWTAHSFHVDTAGVGANCFPSACAGARNGSRWYEIGSLTTTPALVQSGTLFDGAVTNPFGYWIPSVAMSGQGHMALGASRASASAASGGHASIVAAGRLRTDVLGTTQAPTLAQASALNYDTFVVGTERWGDYSQTVVDPLDDMTMWTFQEYVSTVNRWGVRAIRLNAPPPATPDCTVPALVTTTTQDVTITGTSTAGSGFFDPGPDTGGPGFTRLQATVSGGVTVNSVTFNSPTSVTLNVTVTTNGLKNVTLTNPDGQFITGNNCINVSIVTPLLANLGITKTDGQTTASPGQVLTYTIVASNAGPDPAVGASVTDTVPSGLTGATWTCVAAGGATCTPAGSGNINDTVNLPVGGTATYALTGTVGPNAASPLSNTATVTAPPGVTDPTPANNSATDTNTLVFACDTPLIVVPDGRLSTGAIPAGHTRWFGATLTIGRSYSVEFKNTTGAGTPGTLTLFAGDDGCGGTSTVTMNDTSASDPGGSPATARQGFTTAGTATLFRARLTNGSGSPVSFSFGWSDTTLYSPAWSTNGSFDTFYSFQNTTGNGVSGTLTLLDTAGALVASFPVSIPAGQTTSVNTASLAVARNRVGTARFTQNGPPAAIAAETAIANFTLSPAYVQPVKFLPVREAR